MTTITNPIRRTLVLTVGPVADGAGEAFKERVMAAPGVETAVAVLQASADRGNGVDASRQLTDTLTRISPPSLSQSLAEAGWQLVEPRRLHLILLADTAPGAEQKIRIVGETAVTTIYRHLGMDSSVTLIWLAEAIDTDAESCVHASFSFVPQVVALSLLNEDGLRLPETVALSQTAAELVWCLTGTPFYHYLAESLAASEDVYTGQSLVTAMGVAVWGWSQTAVYEALLKRWQAGVYARWLAKAEADPTPEMIATWLQQQKLDSDGVKTATSATLSTGVTAKRFPPSPDYERVARDWPWPWALNKQIVHLKEMFQADGDNITVFKQHAEQQLHLLKGDADERLFTFLGNLLDTQPEAGIDVASRWAWSLQAAWDGLYEQMQDDAATYDGIDQDLAGERGLIDGEIREWQEGWPGGPWSRWLPYSWRVWQWPQLAWHYWHLRQLGLRLARVLAQQSGRRQEKAVQGLVAKTMSELARQGRQWHGRVEEVGEMLKAERGRMKDEGENDEWVGLEIKGLAVEMGEETKVAAEAIGGLGRQLRLLDDVVLQNLDAVAQERLQGVWAVTAVDLLESLYPTPDAWQSWWQSMHHRAAPLWCYDEGLLSEADRQQQWTGTCVLGAGVDRLPDMSNPVHVNGTSPPEKTISRIPSADHSRLLIIRIRHGVTVGTRTVNDER